MAPDLRARIRDRLLGVLLSQTVDILDRGIGDAADLDLGCRTSARIQARAAFELMRALGDAGLAPAPPRRSARDAGRDAALATYPPGSARVLVDGSLAGDSRVVVVITLRRPGRWNALHDEMTDEILAVIRARQADDRPVPDS